MGVTESGVGLGVRGSWVVGVAGQRVQGQQSQGGAAARGSHISLKVELPIVCQLSVTELCRQHRYLTRKGDRTSYGSAGGGDTRAGSKYGLFKTNCVRINTNVSVDITAISFYI